MDNKEKLLLHVCCAPCSSYVLEKLANYFDITVYFYNPNITEKSEYSKRLSELERFVAEAPFASQVKVIDGGYAADFPVEKRGQVAGTCAAWHCVSVRIALSPQYDRAAGWQRPLRIY